MNRLELEKLLRILDKIKNPDSYVIECKHTIRRDLERFNQRKGQLRETYEIDW